MYEYIEGRLVSIKPTYIVVDCQGIGWKINTANSFAWQDKLQDKVKVFVEMVVREDSQVLYGFKDNQDKDLFLTLNKVSGIGPKSALSIMAVDDSQGLLQAIDQGDSTYLTKFPGVGKKTAQQMILDLSGKLEAFDVKTQVEVTVSPDYMDEVKQALVGLGYSQREINRVSKLLAKEDFTSTQDALSFAFKQLI